MTTTPLGIADLIRMAHSLPYPEIPPNHWLWCRRHEQAHKVGERCIASILTVHDPERCIDIGPFMSEREANRLFFGNRNGQATTEPLDMEVKK